MKNNSFVNTFIFKVKHLSMHIYFYITVIDAFLRHAGVGLSFVKGFVRLKHAKLALS